MLGGGPSAVPSRVPSRADGTAAASGRPSNVASNVASSHSSESADDHTPNLQHIDDSGARTRAAIYAASNARLLSGVVSDVVSNSGTPSVGSGVPCLSVGSAAEQPTDINDMCHAAFYQGGMRPAHGVQADSVWVQADSVWAASILTRRAVKSGHNVVAFCSSILMDDNSCDMFRFQEPVSMGHTTAWLRACRTMCGMQVRFEFSSLLPFHRWVVWDNLHMWDAANLFVIICHYYLALLLLYLLVWEVTFLISHQHLVGEWCGATDLKAVSFRNSKDPQAVLARAARTATKKGFVNEYRQTNLVKARLCVRVPACEDGAACMHDVACE